MLQKFALRLYRSSVAQALMRSDIGQPIFQKAYFLYKRHYEASELTRLRPYVDGNAWIFDVGANIGFFTLVFASWLNSGKVLALEPEPENFQRLEQSVTARSLRDRVEVRQLAVAERRGTGYLVMSHESHADHRLGDTGLPVPMETLDAIWDTLDRPNVCLIKIDIQGGEVRALAGARALLIACRPALYVEIDTDPNRAPSGHAQSLLTMLAGLGYRPHAWRDNWIPLTPSEALAEAEQSASRYRDFLFLYQ
jgi:FkbM family methyltransferase